MKRALVIWFFVAALVAMGCSPPPDSFGSAVRPLQTDDWSGTVYIRSDGSIDPPGAPIVTHDSITYTLIDNITPYTADAIVVQRNDIIVDGAGYVVRQTGEGVYSAVLLTGISNVTITNMNVEDFGIGIRLDYSTNNRIYQNRMTGCYWAGIFLTASNDNVILENEIANNYWYNVRVWRAEYNTFSANDITGTDCGIRFDWGSNNTFTGNNIMNNRYGLYFATSPDNIFYHNNFRDNSAHVVYPGGNIWDDGYPNGGNYWDTYAGEDLYSGLYQNEPGSDGLGDTPYVLGASTSDRYPLMEPYEPVAGVQTLCVESATGTGEVCFTTSHGTIEDLQALPVPANPPDGYTFPDGLFSFRVTGLDTDQTVTLTIELPATVPAGTRWWKHHDGQWHDYDIPITLDGSTITITLTDGGVGDIDDVAGQITDPGGPGYPLSLGYTVGWQGQPINKVAVVAPWIGLLAAIAGASLLVLRRRQTQN